MPVLCTEKDAVKLWDMLPQAWAVPLVLTPERAYYAALSAWWLRQARFNGHPAAMHPAPAEPALAEAGSAPAS